MVVERGVDEPAMHALVIGVGRYPYCAEGRGGLAEQFSDVSSPVVSALKVARWLVAEQGEDEIAPLGSVELLVSDTGEQRFEGVAVEAPTFDNIKAAFWRWYERCGTHRDNVAFFFFSGHGCAKGGQLVLPEDVGEYPLNFLGNAIRIEETRAGMATCRAHTQCFFIDACRTVPDELLRMAGTPGQFLIPPCYSTGFRETPTIFATGPGDVAFGRRQGPTVFTGALLEALGGQAARQVRPPHWEVSTEHLGPTIDRLLRWYGQLVQRPVCDGTVRGQPIRRLEAPPRVPFRLGCDPQEALSAAKLSLVRAFSSEVALRREPGPGIWEDEVRADFYRLRASFDSGEFTDAAEDLLFHPPGIEFDLPVRCG